MNFIKKLLVKFIKRRFISKSKLIKIVKLDELNNQWKWVMILEKIILFIKINLIFLPF